MIGNLGRRKAYCTLPPVFDPTPSFTSLQQNAAYQPRRTLCAVGCMRLLAKQPVVICMAADPEPHKAVRSFDREGPMMTSDPSGPKATDLFEMQRRVTRVFFQVRVGPIGEPLNFWRQGSIAGPKIG